MSPMGPSKLLAKSQHRWMTDHQQWRATDTPDGKGGYDRSWSQIGTVRAAFGLPSASEREIAAAEGVQLTHSGKAPTAEDIRRGDRLVNPAGRVIEIIDVRSSDVTAVLQLGGREEPWDEPIA